MVALLLKYTCNGFVAMGFRLVLVEGSSSLSLKMVIIRAHLEYYGQNCQ